MSEAISIPELARELGTKLPVDKNTVVVNKGELYRHLNDMETVIKTLPRRHKVELSESIEAIRALLK